MSEFKIPIQTEAKVFIGADFSQQEPKMTAFVSQDPNMIKAFKENKDIYATIAALAYNMPYEKCLEFHPETREYQPDGKARRTEAKSIVLGITYGRSTKTIGEQLFGTNDKMSDDDKTKAAQKIYDAVLNAFPSLRDFMISSQAKATRVGYVETILGRRRHIPDMQLPRFEFKPMPGYVNPDVDPLDPSTLQNKSEIPERIVKQLTKEFNQLKYYGQIVKKSKELAEQNIKVINNTQKITDATRQCVNCVDEKTEIRTVEGWKTWDQIKIGDKVISFDPISMQMVQDTVHKIITQVGCTECVILTGDKFDAVCTYNHKWPVLIDGTVKLRDTQELIVLYHTHKDTAALFIGDEETNSFNWVPLRYAISDISEVSIGRVWCIENETHNWIARRNGKTYLTGNSIVQGSAAEMTKLAMLRLTRNKRWNEIGGKLLVPIHDELLCEVPMEYAEEGAQILSDSMCGAGDFLPFTISCDVTTNYRWYGLDYPCQYKKPEHFDHNNLEDLTPDEIKWVQYMLFENEYILPVFKNENGEKPKGDAALGVNGILSDDMDTAIIDYEMMYGITDNEFVDHIFEKVDQGRLLDVKPASN